MRGNWVEFTSSTGGTGTLTLTELVGSPSVQDIVGLSGTRWLGYTVQEWSSGTYSGPPIKAEHGIASLTLSTSVLTRVKRLWTWDGTTYATINPAALSFGTTAANIRVSLNPSSALNPDVIPFVVAASPGEGMGLWSAHATLSPTATLALGASGREHYTPLYWTGCGDINQVGLAVVAGQAGTLAKVGIYELATTGLPGNRLFNLTPSSSVSTAAGGAQVLACSAYLSPGWYYTCVIGDSTTATVRVYRTGLGGSMAGATSAGTNITHFTATGNFITGLPTTAPAAGSLVAATTGGPAVFLRPRNT